MAAAYLLDSSALVKRYVIETGTAWVRGLTRHRPATVIYIAHITAVEVTCAIARRRKGKMITAAKASSIFRRFDRHIAGRYTVIGVTPALLEQARRLGRTHALRAYDAVQLAVALEAGRYHRHKGSAPVILISADQALNAAAIAEGLTAEDPNLHP